MKALVRGALAVATLGLLLVVALAGYGATQPRDHEASRSVELAGPLAEIRAALEDVDGYPSWRSTVTRVETLEDGRFVEYQGDDAIRYVFEQRDPKRLVIRIDDPSLPFGGTWTHELAETGGGTRLTTTERGYVDNVLVRGLASLLMDPTDTIDQFHADLASNLAAATPRE